MPVAHRRMITQRLCPARRAGAAIRGPGQPGNAPAQDAEKTPGRSGGSQRRACALGLEVSLCQLSQRCLLELGLAQQLFEARVLLAQLTQLLGLTTIHRPVTLTPSAQRRLADTQQAAGLSCTHVLTSQRLDLLQLHNNLLRRVLRERPHGHPLCPATHGQDYSKQPSRNKRSENSDPSRCNIHLSGVTPLSDKPNHGQGLNHTRGTTPVTWRCTRTEGV